MKSTRRLRIGALALVLALSASACAPATVGGRDGDSAGSLEPLHGPCSGLACAVGAEFANVAVYGLSLPLEAVNASRDWQPIEQDQPLPWIAPGRRVPALAKGAIPNAYNLNGERYGWQVGDRLVYPYFVYNPRLSRYILSDPISRNWEKSDRYYALPGEDYDRRIVLSDYTYYVVSIEPMLVIMRPYPQHRISDDWHKERTSLNPDGLLVSRHDIHYRSEFADASGLLWFSPDLQRGPLPLIFDAGGKAAVAQGPLRVDCQRHGGQVSCVRGAAASGATVGR